MLENTTVLMPLYDEKEVKTAFVKANLALLTKYQQELQSTPLVDKTKRLQSLWKLEYGVDLIEEQQQIKYLRFSNETDRTLFLIRWS